MIIYGNNYSTLWDTYHVTAGAQLNQLIVTAPPQGSDLLYNVMQEFMTKTKPPSKPDCLAAGEFDGAPPLIVSPLRDSAYIERLSRPELSRIAFTASAEADARTIYWFVDDAFVGTALPGVPLYWQPTAAGLYRV